MVFHHVLVPSLIVNNWIYVLDRFKQWNHWGQTDNCMTNSNDDIMVIEATMIKNAPNTPDTCGEKTVKRQG